MSSLNPSQKIGEQIQEAMELDQKLLPRTGGDIYFEGKNAAYFHGWNGWNRRNQNSIPLICLKAGVAANGMLERTGIGIPVRVRRIRQSLTCCLPERGIRIYHDRRRGSREGSLF